MSNAYAEPQQLKNFKIEVIPAGSNTPIVTKQADSPIFTPSGNSSIVPVSRSSELGSRPSNLPPVQRNLRNDGQYRTVDLVPANRNDGSRYYSNAPLRRANDQLNTIRSNGTGLNTSVSFARDEAFAELAYQSGFFLDGLFDGIQGKRYSNDQLRMKRQPIEDMSYNIGNRAGNEAKHLIKDANEALKKVRDDLWKNRPTFEIPQIKVPEFKFELPKIPEFNFPEISFPKPQPIPIPQPRPQPKTQPKEIPIPENLEQLIRDSEKLDCGRISFRLAFVTKVIGTELVVNSDGTSHDRLIRIPGDFSGYLESRKKFITTRAMYFGETLPEIDTTIKAIESAGGSGFTEIMNEGNLKFTSKSGVYQAIPEEGTWIGLNGYTARIPRYEGTYISVDIPHDGSANAVIDYLINPLKADNYATFFYDFQSLSNKEGCSIPKPQIQDKTSPPPEPPPPDCCHMGCCPEPTKINYLLIKRLIVESLKEQKFSVDVPLTTCEFNEQKQEWEPKIEFTTLDFFATSKEQAEQIAQLHFENAKQAAELCVNRNNSDEILKRIGPLPASVPNSLVKKDSGTLQIESLAQYIAYSVKQTNAQLGQFPQEIKIKDADLTQEGDQGQTITMPNLAEAIAEIVGLLLVLRSESAANLVASVNAMIEAGSAKQSAILASDYSAANAEFLGYKGQQIERSVPFTFAPGEAQLDKMLKPKEVKVKGWDNADKNDLNDLVAPILEMAAYYRAANFRNVGTNSPLSKIKDILEGAVKLSDAVDTLAKSPPPPDPNNPDASPPPPKKSDWDEFVESAETGFIAKPGITDNLNPYDRPYTQRPKIREIGADTSEST